MGQYLFAAPEEKPLMTGFLTPVFGRGALSAFRVPTVLVGPGLVNLLVSASSAVLSPPACQACVREDQDVCERVR